MWTANVLFASLLAVAGFSEPGNAARTPQQRREQRNPYVILPPGVPNAYGDGKGSQDLGDREFSLRHIYHRGSHKYPDLHRYLDIPSDAQLQITSDYGGTYEEAPSELPARAASTNIQRLAKRKPREIDELLQHAEIHGEAATLPSSAWTVDTVSGPNITDKKTIITFAKMAANAYVTEKPSKDWQDVKGGFNYTDDFGWEADGLRGHIFADERNRTIVIGLKGSSVWLLDDPATVEPDMVS